MESNLGGTTTTFQNFRKEMDRLTKQLRKVERDTEEWKNKFQESQVSNSLHCETFPVVSCRNTALFKASSFEKKSGTWKTAYFVP